MYLQSYGAPNDDEMLNCRTVARALPIVTTSTSTVIRSASVQHSSRVCRRSFILINLLKWHIASR
eukprot:scaffold487997_cov20-Prasinocladus_malaysianus.AAC.1